MKSTPTVETLYKKLEEVVERFEDTYDSKGLYKQIAYFRDGLNAKLSTIPDAAQIKLQDILSKLVNKGKGNVIAIVL